MPISNVLTSFSSLNFVLHHILRHDLVIELERILLSQFVIDFTLFGLNNICLLWICHVCEAVLVTWCKVLGEKLLMLPGRFLLLHQPLGRGDMSGLVVAVEFAHYLVELIHVEIVFVALLLESGSTLQHSLATW